MKAVNDTDGEQEVSRLRYDKINRLDTSAINEGTFVRGRRCVTAVRMKWKFTSRY